jgi:hypothetical protein
MLLVKKNIEDKGRRQAIPRHKKIIIDNRTTHQSSCIHLHCTSSLKYAIRKETGSGFERNDSNSNSNSDSKKLNAANRTFAHTFRLCVR